MKKPKDLDLRSWEFKCSELGANVEKCRWWDISITLKEMKRLHAWLTKAIDYLEGL